MVRFTLTIRVLALAGFIASHIGFPAVEFSHPLRSGSYPCEGHRCGCGSAEHCWHKCCCMSLRDRLAWADEHGVAPPGDVVASAERLSSYLEDTADKRSCCAQ